MYPIIISRSCSRIFADQDVAGVDPDDQGFASGSSGKRKMEFLMNDPHGTECFSHEYLVTSCELCTCMDES